MVRLLLSAAFALATHASGPSGPAPDRNARLDQLQARIDALRDQVRAALQACPPAPSDAQTAAPSSAPAPPEGTGGSGASVHDGADAKRRLDDLKSKLEELQGQLGSAKGGTGKGTADESGEVAQRVVALGGDLEQRLSDLLKKVDAHVAAGGGDDAHWRELNSELRDLALLMRAWLVQSASAVSLQLSAMEPRLDARFRTLDRRIALRLQAIEDRIDRRGAPQPLPQPRVQQNEERDQEERDQDERPSRGTEPTSKNDEEPRPSQKSSEQSDQSDQTNANEAKTTDDKNNGSENKPDEKNEGSATSDATPKQPEAEAPDSAAVGGSGEPPQIREEKPAPSTDDLIRLRSLSELHPLVVEDALPTPGTEAHVALSSRTEDGRLALVVRPQLEVRLPLRTELRLGADGARVDGKLEGGPFRVALLSQFVESAGARPAVALRLGAIAGSPVRPTEGDLALLATEVMDANRVHLNAVWLPSEVTPRAFRGVLGLDHAFGDRWLLLADALYERRGEETRIGGDLAAAYRFNPHVALRAAVGMVRIGPSLVPQVVLDLDAAD